MSFLAQVTKGKLQTPHLIVLFGVEGVGKSSWAAGAPNPIFLGTEDGTANLNVSRGPAMTSLSQVYGALSELATKPHEFKTLVIDSLDWLEPLVWAHICEANKWTDIEAPGYGKGYMAALDEWRKIIHACNTLKAKGMNQIFIAHSHTKTVQDPHLNEKYDRYELKLNAKAAQLWKEYVNTVGFANFELSLIKDKGERKAKAYGDGGRVLFTERRPAFDAKNRQNLPFQMELSWSAYEAACNANERTAAQFKEAIAGLLPLVKDAATLKAVQGALVKVGDNCLELARIENKLKTLIGE